jgi:NAD/NADP transhydrogenase beta subunit
MQMEEINPDFAQTDVALVIGELLLMFQPSLL